MPILKDKNARNSLREQLYKNLHDDGVNVVETIKTLRKILKMNQQKFSEYVGISLSTLRKIEQGSEHYSLNSLMQILDKFSLKIVVKK